MGYFLDGMLGFFCYW